MSVSEYYDADIDSVSRFAGYYDAAHPDPDEEPPPHLVMHVVAPPLGDVVADHERRIQHLEQLLHRHLNRTEGEL